MARFQPKRLDVNLINRGNTYNNGDVLQPDAINDIVEGIAFLQGQTVASARTLVANNKFVQKYQYCYELPISNKMRENIAVDLLYGNSYIKDGNIKHTIITSLISVDDKGNVLQEVKIPETVLSIEGYGQSNVNNQQEFNYLDIENKVFVKTGLYKNERWEKFETPQKIAIPDFQPFLKVKVGGKIVFQNNDKQPCGSVITYQEV